MGMPITVEILDAPSATLGEDVFAWFDQVDQRFSPYIETSEVCHLSEGKVLLSDISQEMQEVFDLAEATRVESGGAFNIRRPSGFIDPSGIVKGWAISKAAEIITCAGAKNFFIEAGGDIQTRGSQENGEAWTVGIRSPFDGQDIIKILALSGQGMATSGSYARGDHIYDPRDFNNKLKEIVSVSVIADDVINADRFATAAFAMGRQGIYFLETLPGVEGYAVDAQGIATQTTGFGRLVR